MKVSQLFESDLGKKIRSIAATHGLTASAHQHAMWMVLASKKHTRAKFVLKLRGTQVKDHVKQEEELLQKTKAFTHDLYEYLKSLNCDVEFTGGTSGKFVDNWYGRDHSRETCSISGGEKTIFNSFELTRLTTNTTGEQKERLEASHPEAWIEFKITHWTGFGERNR